MNIIPLLVGVFGLIAIAMALVAGRTSAKGRGFSRADQPLAYWASIAAAVLLVCLLFTLALRR